MSEQHQHDTGTRHGHAAPAGQQQRRRRRGRLTLAPPPGETTGTEIPADVAVALDYLWAQVVLLWERPAQRAEATGALPRRVSRASRAGVVEGAADLLAPPPRPPWQPRAEADDGPYVSGADTIDWEPDDDDSPEEDGNGLP